MLGRWTTTTSAKRAKRKRWLALLCILGLFGVGCYAVYTAAGRGGSPRVVARSNVSDPAPRTRFAYTGSSSVAGGLGSFRIRAHVGGGVLYPGAAAHAIRITLGNPNGVAMFVTRLTVTVPSGPAGCESATNIRLVQSNVSSATPVEIHAHDTVTLPAPGRSTPTIQLLDRPVNQDVCRNARFRLRVTGSAHS